MFRGIRIKKLPIIIEVEKTKFDGKISAELKVHLFIIDLTFKFNKKIVDAL